ncbi:hypothetical protein [Clostridium thermobutyricum]|uniref:hypothetical protein n=1 Tax=Clostridium thermobutyricum TaxID=29372 RepID=UPI00039A1493|nr:hypothetical protein [Clostridium thermobutyricum]
MSIFIEVKNIDGEYVSFQLYRTISRINCKKEISKIISGRYKSGFGIYLAKNLYQLQK